MRSALRDTRGQSLLETTMGISLLIPLLILTIDITLIFIAVQTNDSVCSNIARSVAAGRPEDANKRALAILSRTANSPSSWMSEINLAEPIAIKIEQQTTAPISGQIEGSAVASTVIEVRTILLHTFCGKHKLSFRTQQSCPISYVISQSSTCKEIEE